MDNILYPNHRYKQVSKRNRSRKNFRPMFSRSRRQKWINTLLILGIVSVACYLVVFFIYHGMVKPTLFVDNVKIYFQEKLDIDQRDILMATGLNENVRFIDVDEEAVAQAVVKSFPYVEEVAVNKIFPGTVAVKIFGRKPLCISLFDTGTVSVPFAIDSGGCVFELGTGVKEFDLPVLTGVELSSWEMKAQIPAAYMPVLEDLANLKDRNPDIYSRISEIAVDEKGGKGYDLYVYFRTYDLPIQMGSRMPAEEIEAAVQILDLLQSTGAFESYQKLDFRSSKPILKRR